jgi:hypothetical protein
MADSLFLPHEVEASLMDNLSGVEISYGARKDQRRVVVPDMLIHEPELFDDSIAACASIAEEHASTGTDDRQTMAKRLARVAPDLSKLLEYEKILDALWSFTEGLSQLIREKQKFNLVVHYSEQLSSCDAEGPVRFHYR